MASCVGACESGWRPSFLVASCQVSTVSDHVSPFYVEGVTIGREERVLWRHNLEQGLPKAEITRRFRQRIRAVLEWDVAIEFGIDNPSNGIGPVLGPQHDVVQHMRASPHREVAVAIHESAAGRPAGVRVPGACGSTVGRVAVGRVDRDRQERGCVGRTG